MKITKRIEGWVQTGVRIFLEQLYQSYCLEKDVESDASLEIIGWSHSVLKWYNTHRPIKFWLIIGHIGKARNMDDKLQFKWIFFNDCINFFMKNIVVFFFLFNFYNFWEHFDQYTLSWKKIVFHMYLYNQYFPKKEWQNLLYVYISVLEISCMYYLNLSKK